MVIKLWPQRCFKRVHVSTLQSHVTRPELVGCRAALAGDTKLHEKGLFKVELLFKVKESR